MTDIERLENRIDNLAREVLAYKEKCTQLYTHYDNHLKTCPAGDLEERIEVVEKELRGFELEKVGWKKDDEISAKELKKLQDCFEALKKEYYTFKDEVKPQTIWIQERRSDTKKIATSLIVIALSAIGSAAFGLYKMYTVLQTIMKVTP